MAKKVFVSGCYDLLHSGHVEFFRQAAQYGDLYVGIGSDRTILHYKNHKTGKGVRGGPPDARGGTRDQNGQLFLLQGRISLSYLWVYTRKEYSTPRAFLQAALHARGNVYNSFTPCF